MKRIRFIRIFLAAAGISVSIAGFSQQPGDSLYHYLTLASQNNPGVLQYFYEYKAALQKIPQAGGLPDPEFQLGVFMQPMELVMGKEVADLRLMQMFPWFGTLKASKDEMSLMAMAKFESFRDAKLQVFFNVRKSWYELQRLKDEIQYSEKNLEILRTIERLTTIRYKTATTGDNPGLVDLYRIRIEIGDLENNIALLKNQMTTSVARFNSFLNRPSLMPVSLPDSLTADSLGISPELVSDSILAQNPLLDMLSYEHQSLDARGRMVTKMGYPKFGLGLDYSVIAKSDKSTSSMNGQDMIMPMFTMTLPVYRGKYDAMKKETDFLKTANENNYQSAVNSLQTEYYEAAQQLKDSERRIRLYETQTDLAEKTLKIMLSGFSTAETPLSDILRVRQQTLDYEFQKTEAIADYNTAISWLQRLMAVQTIKEK